jgi:hypothetical protein
MLQKTFKILRTLVALALMASGSFILIEGGLSHQPPLHVNWACTALGFGLLLPGAFLLWLGFPPRGRPLTR